MENKFEFNNAREFRSENFKERPQDVLIDGKSIFEREKTPAQQEVVKTAFRLLDEHIKELGIEIKIPFDQKRVIFGYGRKIEEGMYHEGDFVFMNPDSEGNLETMVHEFAHAYSSEWRNYDEAELENYLSEQQKRRHKVKSGFHVVYSRSEKADMFKMENEELPQINFWALNEGITEKIAREIIGKNTKELDRLKPLFDGVLDRKLKEKEKELNGITIPEIEAEIEEKRKEYQAELKQLELKKETVVKDFEMKITNETDPEKKEELEFSKGTEIILADMNIKYKNDNLQKLPEKIEQAKKYYSYEINDLKRNYSFSSLEQGTYDFEVLTVDKIIKGLGKVYLKQNQSSNISVEENRAWQDLQKAYFAGKTVFLRKIEEAFGAGFLRSVEKISPLMSSEEREKFLTDIQETIDKMGV
ncbi:MAG: hypothetical protein KA007_02055 [Candidatus Pacebacteria bacterium]|nr:hypothetical protein [Candidatus Paceibacterota bacterium]